MTDTAPAQTSIQNPDGKGDGATGSKAVERSKSSVQRSTVHKKRYGERYFKIDEGYDRRFYVNEWSNIGRILITFLFFYAFNFMHWWAIFELGVAYSNESMVYQILIFVCTVIVLGLMLLSGKYANEKKRKNMYYRERIGEKEMEVADKKLRDD